MVDRSGGVDGTLLTGRCRREGERLQFAEFKPIDLRRSSMDLAREIGWRTISITVGGTDK
ncbi:hypothetical protein L195_g009539 [Trifolium pratense]|uniref:Uncharacterized protein n=1 Tax=Trifolium pratense TaxID=57577 RepID=A0A2K3PC82_TRIPR|nr:hypothetical protein L195_g009539 [Trifolium pratense]